MQRRAVLTALAATAAVRVGPLRAAAPQPIVWRDLALVDGRTLRADELAGRPVVVEFWASWCPFCAKQNPYIEQLHRAAGVRLQVLTFSIDKNAQIARDYLQRHGYTFATAMAGAHTDAWFGPRRGLPVLHVVDARGRIVFSEAGEMFAEDVAALMRFAR